jgi:hypothetical protein
VLRSAARAALGLTGPENLPPNGRKHDTIIMAQSIQDIAVSITIIRQKPIHNPKLARR